MLLVCQNITLAQFAEQLQGYDPGIFYPVLDGTGIEGAWDFTLSYDPNQSAQMQAALQAIQANARARSGVDTAGQSPQGAEPAEPARNASFIDAIEKQLGLKLETHKRPEPVLVVDHMEEKPTEN